MNEYVIAGEKLYPVKEKIIRSKAGKKYSSKHVKITVATDYYSGKQIQHDYTGKNNNEVQSKINASICLSDEDLNLIHNNITVEELINEYLDYKTGQLSGDNAEILLKVSRRYIFPRVGKNFIRDLTRSDIINLQNAIRNEYNNLYSVATVFYIMKSSFDYACRKSYISYNPCKYAQAYEKIIREQPILKPDQIRKLLVTAKENIYSGVYAIIMFLALRIGEALGLSWDKIDFANKTVTISQQLAKHNKLIKHTKTKFERSITIPECALYFFERQLELQELYKACNPKWNNPDNLVFTDKNGKPLNRASVARNFKIIMSDTSDPTVTLHSLRRTTATILAENVSMLASQYYLGHTNTNSLSHYIYPASKNIEQLANIMAEHFSRPFYESEIDKIYPAISD